MSEREHARRRRVSDVRAPPRAGRPGRSGAVAPSCAARCGPVDVRPIRRHESRVALAVGRRYRLASAVGLWRSAAVRVPRLVGLCAVSALCARTAARSQNNLFRSDASGIQLTYYRIIVAVPRSPTHATGHLS